MRTTTIILAVALSCVILATLVPRSDAHISNRKKLMIAKKIGALLLLHRKKYLFAVPFPLPIPLPLLKKTQPIIYKEKVPVPVEVPVSHPVPEPYPVPVAEPHYAPAHHAPAHYAPAHEPYAAASQQQYQVHAAPIHSGYQPHPY